ncbi:cysteine desulfurase family protein [Bacillus niameyensis]|uniref:cysteine desulfurase family protein n=1 Tax=Bacillus niameyensis TaxID=1522308 RepID=UPI0007848AAA|nr:cysteine desulfurase family protein [Bacillus niameyensis]
MIYFDNSATTRPHEDVLEAFLKVNRDFFGNPSSLHNFGGKAEQLITKAREQIAELAGVKPAEIIFTSGGTEGNNLAIKGAAFQYKGRGNHIISTEIEHSSVKNAIKQLEKIGFRVTWLSVNSDGIVDPEAVRNAITDETILVSIIHVNNEIGTIQPIEKISQILKNYPKIIYHVDHVQGIGKVPLDLYRAAVDLCTFSAHKFHGLKGNGFLFKRNGIRLEPLFAGGNQEQKWRSGTENTGGIVAMAKALRLAQTNLQNNVDSILQIRNFLLEELKKIDDIVVHTPAKAAPHIINFTALGLKGEVLVHALEDAGCIVSTTSACSSKEKTPSSTLLAMGASEEAALGAIRVSLSYENTMGEARQFIEALKKTLDQLNTVVRRNK